MSDSNRHAAVPLVVAASGGVWGVVLLARPADSSSTTARMLGVGLILLGAAFLLRAGSSATTRFDRLDGVVWLGVGAAALVWPDPTVRGLAVLVGLALIATGVVELVSASRGVSEERALLGIGGASSTGFGVAALAWPTVTTLVLSIVVGMRLLVAAVDLLARTVRAGRASSPGRVRRWGRVGVAVVGLVVAATAATVAVAVQRAQPNQPGAFYDAPDVLPGGPGTLVRTEIVEPFVDGATAHRVLYVTSDAEGLPTTASGLVIVPDGEVPQGGRPVMAFTHGTVGIARRCAPSLLPGDVYGPAIPGIRDFLDAGFVVSATDYAGIGSDATTGYLVGSSQAYSALDGVRAAVSMSEVGAAARFVVFGESQGGHAALFTGQLAASYAPELELVGAAAAAPASDLTELFRRNIGTTFGNVLASYALASWSDVYDLDLSEVVAEQALPVIDRIAKLCLQNERQSLAALPEAQLLKLEFLQAPPWEVEPWATILVENTPGGSVVDAPVLIAQGSDDPLVLPDVQQQFVTAWCDRGQTTEYRLYEGVGHLDAGHASAADVTAWALARFAGEPWEPTC